jgi:hypothetical protein
VSTSSPEFVPSDDMLTGFSTAAGHPTNASDRASTNLTRGMLSIRSESPCWAAIRPWHSSNRRSQRLAGFPLRTVLVAESALRFGQSGGNGHFGT